MCKPLKAKYECEIKTLKDQRVVEKVYNTLKQLENQIEIAIEKLLKKGYIKKSESTWVNNLRPVLKPDGSIRVTTNLIALNKLVELDKYSYQISMKSYII